MIVRSGENKRANKLVTILGNWSMDNDKLALMCDCKSSYISELRKDLRIRHDLPDPPDMRRKRDG